MTRLRKLYKRHFCKFSHLGILGTWFSEPFSAPLGVFVASENGQNELSSKNRPAKLEDEGQTKEILCKLRKMKSLSQSLKAPADVSFVRNFDQSSRSRAMRSAPWQIQPPWRRPQGSSFKALDGSGSGSRRAGKLHKSHHLQLSPIPVKLRSSSQEVAAHWIVRGSRPLK
jgi:hypothetical protein